MSEIKDFKFDKRASSYDDGIEGKVSGRFYRLLLREVVLEPNACVLDVGCGTGTILHHMAKAVPIRGFGIDAEANMIAEAKKKCPDLPRMRSFLHFIPQKPLYTGISEISVWRFDSSLQQLLNFIISLPEIYLYRLSYHSILNFNPRILS